MIPKVNNESFLKSTFLVSASSGLSQLILIIFAPIITRLYDPESFGIFTLYQSVIFFLSLSSTLRISNAILTADKNDVDHLVGLSIRINLFIFTVVIFSCYLVHFFISSSLILLIPFALFLSINNVFFLNLIIYSKKFSSLALSRLLQSIVQVSVQCLLFTFGYFGLIYGHFLAQLILLLMYLYFLREFLFTKRIYPKKIYRHIFYKYFNFVRFGLASLLVNNLSRQLPIFFLFVLFSAEISGMYALSYMVLAAPIGLLASNVYSVTLSRISTFKDENILNSFSRDITLLLFYISLPIFLIFCFFGESLFAIIFGNEWAIAGKFAQILSPMLFIVLVVTPLTSVFQLYDKLHIEFKFQVLLLFSRFLSIFIGFYYESFYLAILLFSSSGFLLWFFHFKNILNIVGTNINYLRSCIPTVLFLILIGASLLCIDNYYDSIQSTIIFISIFTICSYLFGFNNIKKGYENIQKNYS